MHAWRRRDSVGRFGSDPVAIDDHVRCELPEQCRCRWHTQPEIDPPIGDSRLEIACHLADNCMLRLLRCEPDLAPEDALALQSVTL